MKKLLIPICLASLLFTGCVEEKQSSTNQTSSVKKSLKVNNTETPLAVTGSEIEKVSKNNYVLIFDDSGSMNENDNSGSIRLDSAKKAVKIFLDSLTEEDNIHFVTLNQGVYNGLSGIKQNIDKIQARGGTPLTDALSYSLTYIDNLVKENKGYGTYTIISITDGESNTDPSTVLKMMHAYSKADITVKTIGFNMPTNNPLNSEYVTYYSATDFNSLKKVLLSIKAESESFSDTTTQFK